MGIITKCKEEKVELKRLSQLQKCIIEVGKRQNTVKYVDILTHYWWPGTYI